MAANYITRSLEPVLRKAAAQLPAVMLSGPRQLGKTTLLKHLFARTHRHVSVESPDVRASTTANPRGFLDVHATPRPALAASIHAFRDDFGEKALPGYVVHSGEGMLPLGRGATAWPFTRL